MSYYIATYEVPADLLEKLKVLAPDYDKQQDVFYDWKDSIDTPRVVDADVMEARYRAISGGKLSTMNPEPEEYEKRFYALLNSVAVTDDENQKNVRGRRRPLSEGYPGISDYEDPADVAFVWKRMEKIIALYPEYAVPDLLADDTFMEIQADHSGVAEVIRFYYGCAMRGSATITIDS